MGNKDAIPLKSGFMPDARKRLRAALEAFAVKAASE
jgi:hypothetical protein